MDPTSHRRSSITALIAAAALAAAAPASAAAAPAHRHGGPDGTGAGSVPAASAGRHLPAGWPKDVPVPPGRIVGSSIGTRHWSIQLLVSGPAREALRSTMAFYRARGFKGSGAVVHKSNRRVTVVTENRDHSPTKTFVVIGVTPLR